jgi:hypothetical protein
MTHGAGGIESQRLPKSEHALVQIILLDLNLSAEHQGLRIFWRARKNAVIQLRSLVDAMIQDEELDVGFAHRQVLLIAGGERSKLR